MAFGGSITNVNISSNKQYVPTESKISNESDNNSKAVDEEMASFFVD